MKLLLDTHAFLWWLDPQPQLSTAARRAIGDPQNDVYISAVVAWEFAIKRGKGQLQSPRNFAAALTASGFQPLAITVEHALATESLPQHHRDPFDRLLVAQAQIEAMHLVTRDPLILRDQVLSILA